MNIIKQKQAHKYRRGEKKIVVTSAERERGWEERQDRGAVVQSLSWVRLFVSPMDCSMPGFPVHHQLPELAQTHVHPVSDAIQPYHPMSFPSPPAFNLSQHQGLFQ